MNIKSTLRFIGAIVLGSLAAYVGPILGGIVAGFAGLSIPDLPPGADMATLAQLLIPISALEAVTLALVARGLSGGFLARWLILTALMWVAFGVNNYLEAAIFTTLVKSSPYVLFTSLGSSALGGAAVAWLIAPAPTQAATSFWAQTREFFTRRSGGQWVWRLLLAFAAFPVAYIVFGMIVSPFVISYYEQQVAGLVLPTWGQILPTLMLRSALFLLVCLPVLIAWNKSRLGLVLTLGGALFMFVGGLNMLQAVWLPLDIRIPHTVEMLADSMVHAGALVVLLVPAQAHAGDALPTAALRPQAHH